MALGRKDRTTIKSLSRADVEKTLTGLRRFAKDLMWVGKNNRYSVNTISKISTNANLANVKSPRHLSQYIAASCLLHCTDGWSYLGGAITSLLRDDPHRSRHLAYYAELRAAMSLLATEGVGIFKNRHFVINGPNSVERLQGRHGTHEFAWNCLEYWGSQRKSVDLFAQVVRPYGRSLDDWLAPEGGALAVAPRAQAWFRQWGMDLRTFPDDQEARNESSYRPDGLPETWQIDPSASLKFSGESWSALEPSPGSTFENIDRHILRITLEGLFKGQSGRAPSEEPDLFKQFVSRIVQYQNLSTEAYDKWIEFFVRRISTKDLSIFEYSRHNPEIKENSHTAIISRAALLLRRASGSTARQMQASGFSADSITFWWEGIGHGRGLWDGERDAGGLLDLWADIEQSLSDIVAFQEQHTPADQSFFRIGSELGPIFASLGSCERVAIWSMIP
jgi:hypothetical protein